MMRESEDLRLSRDDAINSAKETEKKVKTMEADAAQFQEVLRWLYMVVTAASTVLCNVPAASVLSGFTSLTVPLQDLATAERLKRQMQAERDELQDEINGNNTKK